MKNLKAGWLELYEELLQPARERLSESPGLKRMLTPGIAPELLELFLMYFTSLGVSMTEPVEGWIRRAGERCQSIGLDDLGDALVGHSRHEAEHHLLMINDARSLVNRWNGRREFKLDAERLLATPRSPGVQRYVKLHELAISGPTPYAQIAIEYEIEMMSMRVGPTFINACVKTLGPEIHPCLSFVKDHVALDAGHTRLNLRQLGKLLSEHPRFLWPLVAAGTAALDAYASFLDDCMCLAEVRWELVAERSRLLPAYT